jgi:hypothetical protein
MYRLRSAFFNGNGWRSAGWSLDRTGDVGDVDEDDCTRIDAGHSEKENDR